MGCLRRSSSSPRCFRVLCDAPFYTRFDSWMLVRASRKSWYAGKCLEILGLCTCYIVVTTGVGLLASIPIGYGANRWSLVLQQAIKTPFSSTVVLTWGPPSQETCCSPPTLRGDARPSGTAFIAYGTLLGMLTLVLNIAFRRLIGTGLAFLLHTAASPGGDAQDHPNPGGESGALDDAPQFGCAADVGAGILSLALCAVC